MSKLNLIKMHEGGYFSGMVDGYSYYYCRPAGLRVAEETVDHGEEELDGVRTKIVEKSYCVVCLVSDTEWRIIHRETTLKAANNALHDILATLQGK